MSDLYLVLIIVVSAVFIFFWLIYSKIKDLISTSKPDDNLLKIIDSLQKISPEMQKNLSRQSQTIADALNHSTKTLVHSLIYPNPPGYSLQGSFSLKPFCNDFISPFLFVDVD